MGETMDNLLRWLPVIILIVQVVMAWGMWSMRQAFISRKDCEDCHKEKAKETKEYTNKVSDLAADVGKLPERHEFEGLSSQIIDLTAQLGKLSGRLSGINRAVDLLNQHHLKVG